jgi:hypothetical protein
MHKYSDLRCVTTVFIGMYAAAVVLLVGYSPSLFHLFAEVVFQETA